MYHHHCMSKEKSDRGKSTFSKTDGRTDGLAIVKPVNLRQLLRMGKIIIIVCQLCRNDAELKLQI